MRISISLRDANSLSLQLNASGDVNVRAVGQLSLSGSVSGEGSDLILSNRDWFASGIGDDQVERHIACLARLQINSTDMSHVNQCQDIAPFTRSLRLCGRAILQPLDFCFELVDAGRPLRDIGPGAKQLAQFDGAFDDETRMLLEIIEKLLLARHDFLEPSEHGKLSVNKAHPTAAARASPNRFVTV